MIRYLALAQRLLERGRSEYPGGYLEIRWGAGYIRVIISDHLGFADERLENLEMLAWAMRELSYCRSQLRRITWVREEFPDLLR